MLKLIKFKEDWRTFKADETFYFKPGLNVIVGKNGSGKSSLIHALIRNHKILEIDGEGDYEAFDFEKDNVRLKSKLNESSDTFKFRLSAMFHSHGQTNLAILNRLEVASGVLIICDEPDQALHMESCQELVRLLNLAVERGNQIIVTVHNPVVIMGVGDVYDMDSRCWVDGVEYVEGFIGKELSEDWLI